METAMTTFARGIAARKRDVGAFGDIDTTALDRMVVAEAARRETRSLIAADAAERRSAQRDYAWVEAAAVASMTLARGAR